jgi:hypothetical protein
MPIWKTHAKSEGYSTISASLPARVIHREAPFQGNPQNGARGHER